MYDPSIARWNGVDPLLENYQTWSPYNYVLGNPIIFVDPDGKRVVVRDKEAREIALNAINELLGEDNGFSFNRNGVLTYNKRRDKNSKNGAYSENQQLIVNGLIEVSGEDATINVQSSDEEKPTVEWWSGSVATDPATGAFIMEDGKPVMEDAVTGTFQVDLAGAGGSLFMVRPPVPYANVFINPTISGEETFESENEGEKTHGSLSAAVIHELLDHGLDFVRNGNIKKSSTESQENVKYHNAALEILGSPKRKKHDDQ